jgi:phospholipid transport system substrate-binding protein
VKDEGGELMVSSNNSLVGIGRRRGAGAGLALLVLGRVLSFGGLLLASTPIVKAEVHLPSARAELKITIDQLVETVERTKGKELAAHRKAELRKIIWPKFDFSEMSVRSLGPMWKDISEEQRTEFISIFSELLARTYLSRIESIERGMVSIEGEKIYPAAGAGEARALVRTIVTQKGDKFPILYKVVFRDQQWRVYDIIIENVGLIANYRNEFSGIARREGFPRLMERLRSKVSE